MGNSLISKIKEDHLNARKNGDKFIGVVLTTLVSEIVMVGKNNGNRETTDEEAIKIIRKFKKNVEAVIEILQKNSNDSGIVELKEDELVIYESYLPQELSEDDLRGIIIEMIHKGYDNMGSIMKMMNSDRLIFNGKTAALIILEEL